MAETSKEKVTRLKHSKCFGAGIKKTFRLTIPIQVD
jgi:hypothetical protein